VSDEHTLNEAEDKRLQPQDALRASEPKTHGSTLHVPTPQSHISCNQNPEL